MYVLSKRNHHDEVFDDIRQSPFSLKEAAEYLKVADITVRKWVKEDKLSFKKIGRNLVFDPDLGDVPRIYGL